MLIAFKLSRTICVHKAVHPCAALGVKVASEVAVAVAVAAAAVVICAANAKQISEK